MGCHADPVHARGAVAVHQEIRVAQAPLGEGRGQGGEPLLRRPLRPFGDAVHSRVRFVFLLCVRDSTGRDRGTRGRPSPGRRLSRAPSPMPSSDSSRRICRPPAWPGVGHTLARRREVSHVPTAQLSAMPRSRTPPRSPRPRLYRSKVGHWRGSCSAPFPMPSFRTVLEVLPHTALPQAVDQTHSTVPQVLVPGPSDLRGSSA